MPLNDLVASPLMADSRRPRAVNGDPIRIAAIRARRYANGLYARSVAATRKVVGCCFSCLDILIKPHFIFSSEGFSTMNKAITIAALAAILLGPQPVMAETVKRGLVACVSEELLDEIIGYVAKKDNSGFTQLLMSGKCTILKEGEQVSVINPGFMTATIRYRGVKMFTPSEAVR